LLFVRDANIYLCVFREEQKFKWFDNKVSKELFGPECEEQRI